MRENAAALNPPTPGHDEEHSMVALMDALQCCGVRPDVASNVAASVARNKPRFHSLRVRLENARRFVGALTDKTPQLHGGLWARGNC